METENTVPILEGRAEPQRFVAVVEWKKSLLAEVQSFQNKPAKQAS